MQSFLKARLLHIGWIKVDDTLVYKAEPKAAENDAQETQAPVTGAPKVAVKDTARDPRHPLVDTTPFGSEPELPVSAEGVPDADDAALFGLLWPLGDVVKLDATVERRVMRQQRDRLMALGYTFEPLSQDWHRIVV